ncbi:DUF6289 family protein [Saccharothrix sp. ALI-22-I]|uniref:DUF6289 family protein n=1 Tax=Saccharothrix sp. ALI-22-I TaxID=1933778 RepID=UPI001179EF0B|nr:DUF6289 family protein [Saccharothrix sp. ALI-22-I]
MIRRVVSSVVLVSAMAAVPVLAAAPAQAIPACKAGYQCARTYYSDATYEFPVGGYLRTCEGTSSQWGKTARYVETVQSQCN